MKFSKSCSLILSGCLLAPLLSGCLGELFGSSKAQETPEKYLQRQQQERKAKEAEAKKAAEEAEKEEARKKAFLETPEGLFQQALKDYKDYESSNPLYRGDPTYYKLFEKAAKMGSGDAYRYLGIFALNNDNYEQAMEYYQTAVQKGSADALDNIGSLYMYGQGVSKNYAKALEYFKKAAEKGSAVGAYDAGVLYSKGQGVPKDSKKANEYFMKAAERGWLAAFSIVGSMYATGNGVPKDLAKAREYYQKASDGGDAQGSYMLGYMYERGEGGPKDLAKTLEYYQKASDGGYAEGSLMMGEIFYFAEMAKKFGVTQDYDKALKYFGRATKSTDKEVAGEANFILGVMYLKGDGVLVDKKQATEYVRKACDLGYEKACTTLSK
ncbi:SEL1-like repeat protein [Helicobacter felis]|uniref:SEL1-like repeat protein n=1 Tax=Helicobacter felis TaxID=214 RepID=UPI000CEF3E0B|nr:tetratricopeptide repeat protein [Helicobacter felis]